MGNARNTRLTKVKSSNITSIYNILATSPDSLTTLTAQNATLTAQNATLTAQIANLTAQIANLTAQIATLTTQITTPRKTSRRKAFQPKRMNAGEKASKWKFLNSL